MRAYMQIYKAEMKFCVSLCKLTYVYAHAQTKRPAAPKFSIKILKRDFCKDFKAIFVSKNWSRLFTGTYQNLEYLFGLQVT